MESVPTGSRGVGRCGPVAGYGLTMSVQVNVDW